MMRKLAVLFFSARVMTARDVEMFLASKPTDHDAKSNSQRALNQKRCIVCLRLLLQTTYATLPDADLDLVEECLRSAQTFCPDLGSAVTSIRREDFPTRVDYLRHCVRYLATRDWTDEELPSAHAYARLHAQLRYDMRGGDKKEEASGRIAAEERRRKRKHIKYPDLRHA